MKMDSGNINDNGNENTDKCENKNKQIIIEYNDDHNIQISIRK